MRILLYDNNKKDFESIYQMIKLLPIQTVVDVVTNYEDSIQMYQRFKYKKVFINFIDESGKALEKHIVKTNPKQKLILLKDDYDCILNHSCEDCQKFFDKYLVIKPMHISQLPKIINGSFECEGFSKTLFEYNIEKIYKTVLRKYPTIIFDKKNLKFSFDNIPNAFIVELFIELTTLLSNHNMEYRIYENKSIFILTTQTDKID